MIKLLTAFMLTASLMGANQPAYILKSETPEIPTSGVQETEQSEAGLKEAGLSEAKPERSEASQGSVLAITFKDSGIEASSEKGISIENQVLTITSNGSYTITGDCADGKIIVKDGLDNVNITLKSLKLSSKDGSPIEIGKKSKVIITNEGSTLITALKGTQNSESSIKETQKVEGSIDEDAHGEAAMEEPVAASSEADPDDPKTAWETFNEIYAEEDKAIEESKKTQETAEKTSDTDNVNPVIKVGSGASLEFAGNGTLKLDSSEAGDAIQGEESSAISLDMDSSGELSIKTAGDGIDTDGSITVFNGTLKIDGVGDGIAAESDIEIKGGDLDIDVGGEIVEGTEGNSSAVKSGNDIKISGGAFNIYADNDGISADGNLTVTAGKMEMQAGDDGLHADYELVIGDGDSEPTININQSVEGIEGAKVTVNSGEVNVFSSDDGINAANKELTDFAYLIEINGGQVYVDAQGDGLDSNGSVEVNGGSVVVYGADTGENAAVDFEDEADGTFAINGGQVVALGQNVMVKKPTSGKYISFGIEDNLKVDIQKGDTVKILSEDGTEVVTIEAAKAANCVIYSDETIDPEGTYTLEVNGTAAEKGSEEEQPKPEDKPAEGEKPEDKPADKPVDGTKPEDKPKDQEQKPATDPTKPSDPTKPAEGKTDTKTDTETKPAEQKPNQNQNQNQNQQNQQNQNSQQQQNQQAAQNQQPVQQEVQKMSVKGVLKVTKMVNGSPAAVRISILGDGQVVKQTNVAFKDGIGFEFTDLPVSANGKNISYSMQVAGHSLYDFAVTQNADGTYVVTATPVNASKVKSTQTGLRRFTIPALIVGGLGILGVLLLRRRNKAE